MKQRPIAESLFVVPMGNSARPYDTVYRMLVEALAKKEAERIACLESVIILLVDMRLDGIVDTLCVSCKLNRREELRAEATARLYSSHAIDYLHSLLIPTDQVSAQAQYENLCLATRLWWGIQACAVAVIGGWDTKTTPPPRPQLPRPRDSGIN
jgi:hypothetical protein